MYINTISKIRLNKKLNIKMIDIYVVKKYIVFNEIF